MDLLLDGPMDIREGRIEAFADRLTRIEEPTCGLALPSIVCGSGISARDCTNNSSDFGTQSPLPRVALGIFWIGWPRNLSAVATA